MKKSSLVLVALLFTAPVFADEAKAPLTLASADTSASVNLQTSAVKTGLDKEVNEFSDALAAKVDADLSVKIAKAVNSSVKF